MADIESNIKVNIDTSDALTQLKLLQKQISAFQQAMRNAGAQNAAAAAAMQQNLITSINATGKFRANIQTIKTTAESFTESLEKNKLSIGQYFRYAGGASKTFGKLFKSEFETIQQVAIERVKEVQTQYIKLGRDANGAMKAIAVKPLTLDMANLGTKTQIAAQRQQLFNQLMKQGSTSLLNFGKNTQWAGRQLMVGFTVPLVMMGSAASKAYMQIEAASVKFKRVYGDMNTTNDEANKMVKSVQALANEFTKYGVAVADTMDMAAQAAAMGKTGTDLIQQIQNAAKLSVLGGVDQNKALETTISLTNAFGVSAKDLGKNIDFLNAVENQTTLSIEDLTIAIPKAAPVVRQLGGDVKDLAFFLTAMKEGGINASEGANAIKSGLASLINPSAKASKFLQGFGINVKGIVEADKGNLKKTVVDFASALDKLDPLNRARAIEQMFGKFQFSRISTLFQNVIAEGSQAQQVAGLANNTAEELAILSEREMKKISDSPMFKFQKSMQDMQAKLAPVGEAFLKAVTPIVEFVSKILDGFNNLSSGAKNFITLLVTVVAGIGPILLMTFGLIANGIANIMKLFTNVKSFINKSTKPSDLLGEQTSYMTTEQLKGAAIASSLDQAHAKLRQTFTSEVSAVNALTEAYRQAVQAQQAFSGVPNVPVGNPNAVPAPTMKNPRKYATGVSMVPGPAGAGDIVPALLSPGEAVIPAKHARKYAPVIAGMVSGNLPGFENGTTGVGMRQSMIGPMTEKQIEGLQKTGKTMKEISDEVAVGPYGQTPPTNYGTQISQTTGHSFPAFGVGGVYEKPDGTKVFVKPQIDLVSAMAEIRGTTIARDAHGLVAPKQALRVMMDPTDPDGKRKFLVLESPLDERIENVPTSFTKEQYFKQLVASLLRGDKDLGVGNLGGDILADVGPAGVFQRASGKRQLGGRINSMEEQAIINLLGVKGGAKKFFAESTSEIAKSMSPAEYDAAIKAEIQAVAPRLQATISGFGNLSPEEKQAYMDMQQRLQAGMSVDWGKYQVMHSAVKPKQYSDGGFVGIENSQLFSQKLMGMSSEQIRQSLRIQDTHLVEAIDITKNPQAFEKIKEVLPGVTKEELRGFEPVSNLTAQLPGNMNQKMKPGGPGYPPQIFASMWDGFVGKLSKSAEIAEINLPSSQIIEDELGTAIRNHGTNINDPEIGKIVGEVLGNSSKIENQKLYGLALRVAQLRSKPLALSQSGNDSIHSIALRMLRDGSAQFNDNGTSLVRTIGNGNITRFGTWEYGSGKYKVGSDAANATIEEIEIRRRAREAAYGPNGWATLRNFNAPMPTVNRKLIKPTDWKEVTNPANWNKMTKAQQDQYLSAIPGTDPTTLSFRKQDYEQGFGNSKGPASEWTYDSGKLKSGIKWRNSAQAMQLAYNEMSKNGIIPAAGQAFFNKLASGKEPVKMAEGGIIPGGMGKPKASVFDVDDTLLDLASFMPAHQERNKKLPKEQRLNWWEEVAKNPKGIPAAIQKLKEAQLRGNKILLMTARPKSYDEVTLDTLRKLGIDTNGVKLISRESKDYRKPEQMKYDKTSKYQQWYDIEEFYDDMAKTRGAVSLLGIPTIDPLKLAKGGMIPGYADGVSSVLPQGFSAMPTDAEKAAQVAFVQNSPLAQIQHGDALSSLVAKSTIGKGNQMFRVPTIRQNEELATKQVGDIIDLGNRFTSIADQTQLQAIGATAAGKLNTGNRERAVNTILKLVAGYDMPGIMNHSAYNPDYKKQAFGEKAGAEYPFQSEGVLPPGLKGKITNISNGIPKIIEVLMMKLAKGGVIPRYANGVFSVPGPKGAGDVVPAMLSPGEAVIPADRAAQHRGLIQGMIAGNLPGYAKGTIVPGYNSGTVSVPGYEFGIGNVPPGGIGEGFNYERPLKVILVGDETSEKSNVIEEQAAEAQIDSAIDSKITDEKQRELIKQQKEESKKREQEAKQQAEEAKIAERKLRSNQARVENNYDQMTPEEQKKFDKNLDKKYARENKGPSFFSKAFKRNEVTGRVQGAMYGLSAITGAASMMPGAIGQTAQAALPAIGAVTSAMQMIPGPAGMVVGALAAIVTVGMQVSDYLKKLGDEARQLGEAMGSSGKAIQKFAEFAKTVTATETMNKRRETSAGAFYNVVAGKKTFGESYMESDSGKQLVKDVGQATKTLGLKQAKQLMVEQLSASVVSGALSPAQARSVAANLGTQLGDMQFGIEVIGKMSNILGPNGKDLNKNPLEVRTKLITESVEQLKQTAIQQQKASANVAPTMTSGGAGAVAGGIGAGVVAGFGGAAIAGALSGSVAGTAGAMLGSVLGAQAFGPVVGAIAGLAILTTAAINAQGEIIKNAGYLSASLGSALSTQQQMVDSLQVDYEKRIASAKATGDMAEARKLEKQYLVEQAQLLQFNKDKTQEMYDILNKQGTGVGMLWNAQMENMNAAAEGLKKAFEGTGLDVQANMAVDTIKGMQGSDVQKTMLLSAVGQKQIGLNQIQTAGDLFGGTKEGSDQLQKLLTNSPTELNRTLGLAGGMDKITAKKFVLDMSLKDPVATKQMNDALEFAQKTTGVFYMEKKTVEAIMKFSVQNPELMADFVNNLSELKNVAANDLTITVAQKILGPDLSKALGEKSVGAYFKKYNKQNKIVFLSEFQQVMTMLQEGDVDMIKSYNTWNATQSKPKSFADYAAWQSDRTVTDVGMDNTVVPGGGDGNTPVPPSASFIDPYVQTIREATNLAQNITVGWFDSLKALGKYKKGTLDAFSGQAVLLKQAGASDGLIQAFLGGSEEDQNRMFAKAKAGISSVGKEIIAKAKEVEDAKIGLDYILSGPMGQLQKKNELYQAGLDVIAFKEKKVNDKYDKRVKALDEIGKIQEKNNQRQQDTLTLADALSKGDIAGAARAAMTAKQNSQKQALEDAKESIENARKKELGTITTTILGQTVDRDKLEANIATNSEKIANNKKIELNHQVEIGIHAQKTADALSASLDTLKGYSKIKLPTLKVSTISANKLNATSINGTLTDNPTSDQPQAPTKEDLKSPVATIKGSAGKGGKKILDDIIASTDIGAAKKQAKVVRSNYLAAQTSLTNAGGQMTEAQAKKKFGGTNTSAYKKWAKALKKFSSAETAAENWDLFTDTGQLKTEDILNNATADTWLSDTAGYDSFVQSKMNKLPAAVIARLDAIKGSHDSFVADQDELKTLKQKIDDIKKNFSGASAKFKNKTVYEMLQNYNSTSDLLKPKSAWGQLLAGGADPQAYLDKGVEMANKFFEINGYRKDLKTAGYSSDKLYDAGLLSLGNGQTLEEIEDFVKNQMFKDRKRHNPPKQSNVDVDNLAAFGNKFYASGGMVIPNGYRLGGGIYGTDTVPAMLTPGEFVIRKSAVDAIGSSKLKAINNGTYGNDSVYNYSITLNVSSSSDSNEIADAVLRQIKRIDSQRLRSNVITNGR